MGPTESFNFVCLCFQDPKVTKNDYHITNSLFFTTKIADLKLSNFDRCKKISRIYLLLFIFNNKKNSSNLKNQDLGFFLRFILSGRNLLMELS